MKGLIQVFLHAHVRKAAGGYRVHMEAVHHVVMAIDVLILLGRGSMHGGQFGEVFGLEGPEEDLLKVLDVHTSEPFSNTKKGLLTFRVTKRDPSSFLPVRLRVG